MLEITRLLGNSSHFSTVKSSYACAWFDISYRRYLHIVVRIIVNFLSTIFNNPVLLLALELEIFIHHGQLVVVITADLSWFL